MPHRLHLSKDKKLREIMANRDTHELIKRDHVHLRLCESIISQQLSTKVADVIYGRFLKLFRKKTPAAKDILAVDIERLRSIGLSYAKANYVHNVCHFFLEKKLTDARLRKMSDEELMNLLTQIKGVGHWTAEMILMFTLGREDIFPADDLVIQQTMALAYKLDLQDKKALKAEMLRIAEKWSPYRTYACKYLWGMRDGG
ncbi:MAG: DNA-3-methyladenine glycosylase 2 family protein [Ferruginibacter sp.]